MSCLGVHFSLSEAEVQQLRGIEESERVDHVHEVIEEEYFGGSSERFVETDKSWDAMHRTFASGQLSYDSGQRPLDHLILGGELLYTEDDFIMSLKSPQQVQDVAALLPSVTKEDFRRRYFAIDQESYGFPLSEEDFDYTWTNFQDVRRFWLHAAGENRHVLFTVDQ